jgi:hypothetical protein
MTSSNRFINSRRSSAAAYSAGVSSGRVEREPRDTSHRMHLSFLVDGFPTRDAVGSPQTPSTHAPAAQNLYPSSPPRGTLDVLAQAAAVSNPSPVVPSIAEIMSQLEATIKSFNHGGCVSNKKIKGIFPEKIAIIFKRILEKYDFHNHQLREGLTGAEKNCLSKMNDADLEDDPLPFITHAMKDEIYMACQSWGFKEFDKAQKKIPSRRGSSLQPMAPATILPPTVTQPSFDEESQNSKVLTALRKLQFNFSPGQAEANYKLSDRSGFNVAVKLMEIFRNGYDIESGSLSRSLTPNEIKHLSSASRDDKFSCITPTLCKNICDANYEYNN